MQKNSWLTVPSIPGGVFGTTKVSWSLCSKQLDKNKLKCFTNEKENSLVTVKEILERIWASEKLSEDVERIPEHESGEQDVFFRVIFVPVPALTRAGRAGPVRLPDALVAELVVHATLLLWNKNKNGSSRFPKNSSPP